MYLPTFADLLSLYQTPKQIPDDVLYKFIKRDDVFLSIVNQAKLGIEKVIESDIGQEIRRRSRQDLFWLARYFTWETNPASIGRAVEENKITEAEYRVICDLFVKKDNSKPIIQQDEYKSRLLLWPRGGFKSTIDVCDAAQWILNFPEIRILFMTGTDDLAVGFMDELKGHFLLKLDEPSLMNLFFPEFCLEETKMGNEFEFTCPVWAAKGIKRKEATVLASSIGSAKSGWHFELIKADDAVCDKNSESSEMCKKISKKLFLADKLLIPGGYFLDYIGTRYHDDDHYGVCLEQNIGNMSKTENPCWTFTENITTGMKILIGTAIRIKPEVIDRLRKEGRPITYVEAGEAGCDLLIPTVMPYSWLMKEYAKDEISFEAQLNQNPRPSSKTVFERIHLISHTVPFKDLPFRGPISQTWDFAFSKKKGRDYSTGSTVIWNDKGAFYVTDLIRAKFSHIELAKAIVDSARKWRPFIIGIEDAAGSRFLEPTIIAEAQKTGIPEVMAVCSKIDWFTPDNQKDAKATRMQALHTWLMHDRMWFASYIPHLQVLYEEFERCLVSHHHDDIPDVLSQQPRYAPAMQQIIEKKEIETWSRSDAAWNIIFEENCDAYGHIGSGGALPIVVPPPDPEPIINAEIAIPGADPVLGCIYG